MTTQGVVREWHNSEGWGVIDSGTTPGGCWVHVSHLRERVFGSIGPGSAVELTWEAADQDGYAFRAVEVWAAGEEPSRKHITEVHGSSSAYRSGLTISFDDEPDRS